MALFNIRLGKGKGNKMISVINKDFFTMRRHTITSSSPGTEPTTFTTLVNLYTDPKNAELHKYEKKAFMSFVFHSAINPKELSDDDVYNIMSSSEIKPHSMYVIDSDYDKITGMFPAELRYPTMIFERTNNYTAKNLCLIAMPIKGIIPPIPRSNMYKLYNGSFVVCKLFKFLNPGDTEYEYYNKIIYILVDIVAEFSFNEFIKTNDNNYGVLNTYAYSLSPKDTTPSNVLQAEISQRKLSSLVPYKGRTEEFFEPKDPNIFKLSDVPPQIFIKKHSIVRELKAEKQNSDEED